MFDTTKYYGDPATKPTWDPDPIGSIRRPKLYSLPNDAYVIDHCIDLRQARNLIAQFEEQPMYPVGINGYAEGDQEVGSHRAMAWGPALADSLYQIFDMIPEQFEENRIQRMTSHTLGSTPWLRFMKYVKGGQHLPHYDAPFICQEEQYHTRYSWVLYLNDVPENDGGAFQFVNDEGYDGFAGGYWHDYADWKRMAFEDEITLSVKPVAGRMLIFPHRLCHQVQEYTGDHARYIIRGDVAYAN